MEPHANKKLTSNTIVLQYQLWKRILFWLIRDLKYYKHSLSIHNAYAQKHIYTHTISITAASRNSFFSFKKRLFCSIWVEEAFFIQNSPFRIKKTSWQRSLIFSSFQQWRNYNKANNNNNDNDELTMTENERNNNNSSRASIGVGGMPALQNTSAVVNEAHI